ncbi:MAG TPA: hypothetical protein VFJ85_08475 [Acidimicrobiales bacterium]|nr:hypothetical protein [Acidimicrobiales bacterium]
MARFDAPCRYEFLECVVGWDPPLGTFFAQVFDLRVPIAPDDIDEPDFWAGCRPAEVTSVAELRALVAAWVDIDEALAAELEADREAEPAWPPMDAELRAFCDSFPDPYSEGHSPRSRLRELAEP